MKLRRIAVAIAWMMSFALAASVTDSSMATAGEVSVRSVSEPVSATAKNHPWQEQIDNNSIIALPEELIELGFDAEEVEMQRKLWSSLPGDVAGEQLVRSTNARDEFAEAYEDVQYYDEIATTSLSEAPLLDLVTPFVSQASCPSNTTPPYTIRQGVTYHCFTGSVGTLKLSKLISGGVGHYSIAVQAAKAKGRFGYMINGSGFYWSVTRGPNDTTWHNMVFTDQMSVLISHVQFL